ncbi:hypothetical protein E4T56_gene11545 [Termitomyces sp. T112]|nr:hypothetical protein E4T56_gene11545 [Termitomyces sp. T112]
MSRAIAAAYSSSPVALWDVPSLWTKTIIKINFKTKKIIKINKKKLQGKKNNWLAEEDKDSRKKKTNKN